MAVCEVTERHIDHTKKVLQRRYDSKIAHHGLGVSEASHLELIPFVIELVAAGEMHHDESFQSRILLKKP